MSSDLIQFSALSDDQPEQWKMSPRLEAILTRLPKPYGTRVFDVLTSADICTVAKLCSIPPRELRRLKNCGKKLIAHIDTALGEFGLRLEPPPSPRDSARFSELSDDQPGQWKMSPRLEAILTRLPKPYGTRVFCVLTNADICTVAKLCSTPPRDLQRLENCGKKSIAHIDTALAAFGLRLEPPPTPCDMERFSELSDDRPAQWRRLSPRLAAVLDQLPKKRRGRVENLLLDAGIYTVAALCSAPLRSQRRREIGEKTLVEIEGALGAFGLSLAEQQPPEKRQSPAQRRASPVWLRQQITKLVADCKDTIAEDQTLADKERDDVRRVRYLASVDCHRHWKRQLERILIGETAIEDLADTLIRQGVDL